MIIIWLAIVVYCVHLKTVICISMMRGTELIANPYSEAVFIQKKPSTTICMGFINDEKTVYTSSLCEVGLEPVTSYHIAEAPHYKATSSFPVHNIKNIQLGKGKPFDLKIITLEEPFEFCANCSAAKVELVDDYDDYRDRFDVITPGVVLGYGPPFKAAVVKYKISGFQDCQQDYSAVKEASWPARLPIAGGFCVYEGSAAINISIPNKLRPVTTHPGVPCDDSVGSLVKIDDYGRTIGIIIKGFCGAKKVAIGYGSYYLKALPFEPDSWKPPLPPTSTTPTTSSATSNPSHGDPSRSPTITDKPRSSFVGVLIHIFIVISMGFGY